MILDRVTITGADDSTSHLEMVAISLEHPYVEWGILVGSGEGHPRFPGRVWIAELVRRQAIAREYKQPMRLSLHLCGRPLRTFCKDGSVDGLSISSAFQRVQLNWHAIAQDVHSLRLAEILEPNVDRQFIFQIDGVNRPLFEAVDRRLPPGRAVPLFDTSGGAGIVPRSWPMPYIAHYCGYAGGLGPDNVVSELGRMPLAERNHVWIDMERRVRTADDKALDMKAVRSVLERCAPLVSEYSELRAGEGFPR